MSILIAEGSYFHGIPVLVQFTGLEFCRFLCILPKKKEKKRKKTHGPNCSLNGEVFTVFIYIMVFGQC